MNTDSHTPGPWKYRECATDSLDASHHVYAGSMIADVLDCHDDATCKANARLIAAAPDLLACLRELHDNLADCGEDELAEKAWRAIAKASGSEVSA